MRERLESVGVQLPELLRHHRVLHHSVLLIYVSVTLFLLCMVALAVSAITGSPWIDPFAFVIFLGGISMLLYGMVMTALDFATSTASSKTRYIAPAGSNASGKVIVLCTNRHCSHRDAHQPKRATQRYTPGKVRAATKCSRSPPPVIPGYAS
ncbi:MAG: DUF2721 domain-containing protein [Coleofasciculaceae cyanobacterium SM2_3_26]|nr:DUF2721 domain-containing protein [Coleofasciculaceae cyanobacterium SM2_3_26]